MEQQEASHTIPSSERSPPADTKSPSRKFWVILAVMLTCGVICTAVAGALGFTQRSPKVVRLNFQNRPASQGNQSAFVDKAKSTVTYYVISPSNQTTAVLFDIKNGYICYKPAEQNNCYLRLMDAKDRDTIQVSFNLSEHKLAFLARFAEVPPRKQIYPQGPSSRAAKLSCPKTPFLERCVHKADPLPLPNDRTMYYREFLGIVSGRPVQPEDVGEAVRSLCEQVPIYWVKKKDGPAKQRLIYLCIDICFPSNICVSICFYYLPE